MIPPAVPQGAEEAVIYDEPVTPEMLEAQTCYKPSHRDLESELSALRVRCDQQERGILWLKHDAQKCGLDCEYCRGIVASATNSFASLVEAEGE